MGERVPGLRAARHQLDVPDPRAGRELLRRWAATSSPARRSAAGASSSRTATSTSARASSAWGPSSWSARYNYLNIGEQVFTAGLADPNLWTNQLYTTDLGVNWYWTQYIKVYIGWQHAGFGNPVLFAPGRLQTTSDQFWLRFQIFF